MADEAAYFESKEFQEILKQYEEAIKSEQTTYIDADDLADIADYYHYEGRFEEAEDAINLALHFSPNAPYSTKPAKP